ncbi:DUF6461 domain-containing protein [Streptomyces sp. NPDC054775]
MKLPKIKLADAMKRYYWDQCSLVCINAPQQKILSSMGLRLADAKAQLTPHQAAERFHSESTALRVTESRDWTLLLEVNNTGFLHVHEVLAEISKDSEAVAYRHLLDSTSRVAHAIDGRVVATYDDWLFDEVEGDAPDRLTRAFESGGVFDEEKSEEDDWDQNYAIINSLQSEFNITISDSAIFDGPLPTFTLGNCVHS